MLARPPSPTEPGAPQNTTAATTTYCDGRSARLDVVTFGDVREGFGGGGVIRGWCQGALGMILRPPRPPAAEARARRRRCRGQRTTRSPEGSLRVVGRRCRWRHGSPRVEPGTHG